MFSRSQISRIGSMPKVLAEAGEKPWLSERVRGALVRSRAV
jgi:hypothetical protein